MEKQNTIVLQIDFFLGASTTLGYKSYLATLRTEGLDAVILLKGAPSAGQVKILDSVAHGEGGMCECLHHPQDPTQLIGVVVKAREAWGTSLQVNTVSSPAEFAIVDASTAQALTPVAPSIREHVVSLYHLTQPSVLRPKAQEIEMLFAQATCQQTRIARYIASLSGLLFDSRRAAACATDFAKIERYAQNLCTRLLPPLGKQGSEKQRFLTAITPQGNLCYRHTVEALAERIFMVCDEYGAVSKALFSILRTEAVTRGYDIIVCPCALFGEEKIEHLFIPALNLAFLTNNVWHTFEYVQAQNIHYTRFTDTQALKSSRTRLRFNTKAAKELQGQCSKLLAELQETQEAIRARYRLAIDYTKLKEVMKRLKEEYELPLDEKDFEESF